MLFSIGRLMHPYDNEVTAFNFQDKADQFANADRVMAIGLLLMIPAAAAALFMVRQLSDRQAAALRRRARDTGDAAVRAVRATAVRPAPAVPAAADLPHRRRRPGSRRPPPPPAPGRAAPTPAGAAAAPTGLERDSDHAQAIRPSSTGDVRNGWAGTMRTVKP